MIRGLKMRGVYIIILIILAAVPPNITLHPPQEKSSKGSTYIRQNYYWTLMIYLDGDNDLETYALDDFMEISSVGSDDNVSILVLFDRWDGKGDPMDNDSYGDWTDTRIYHIEKSEPPNPENADKTLGERNMGEAETLIEFLNYSISNYPAEHYALILWDHGYAYHGICFDFDNNDRLEISELRHALDRIHNDLGVRIDLLGIDACLSGIIDMVYGCREYVNLIVFSQEYEESDGWPYDNILSKLISNPMMTPEELARTIVDEYMGFYDTGSPRNETLSVINTTSFYSDAIPKLNRLTGYLLRNYDYFKNDIISALSASEEFSFPWLRDLTHFLINLNATVSNKTLRALIGTTVESLNRTIIYSRNLGLHPNAYGVSAYFPQRSYDTLYDNIELSIHHQWDEFAKKIGGLDPELWLYDAWFDGADSDTDGYMDSDLRIYVDLDSSIPVLVDIEVYGSNGSTETLLGEVRDIEVNGSTTSDIVSIDLFPRSRGIYDIRIDILSNEQLVKQYYYYFDDDTIGLPLEENMDYRPPTIYLLEPENKSIITKTTVNFSLDIENTAPIESTYVYINGTLELAFDGKRENFSLTFEGDGTYVVKIRVVDLINSSAECVVIITIYYSTTEKTPKRIMVNIWLMVATIVILTLFLICIMGIKHKREAS